MAEKSVSLEAGDEGLVEFKGKLVSINGSTYTVGSQAFKVTDFTAFDDRVQVGDLVEVHAKPGQNGVYVIHRIELQNDSSLSSSDDDVNDDHGDDRDDDRNDDLGDDHDDDRGDDHGDDSPDGPEDSGDDNRS